MKKKISLLLSLCLLISLLAGYQQEAGDSPDSDTLVIATVSDIASLDPSRMTSSYELYVGTCVYDSLTWLPLGASEPAMRLAESYTVSDDGLTYTFTLRDGPLFHNGEPVTAEDVLYSVELFRSAAALSSYSYNIAGCESPDEKTVVITLSAPDPAFFENFNWCFVLPKAAHEEAGGDFGTQPVGSGPYQPVSYTAVTRT